MLVMFLYAPFALHWNARVSALLSSRDGETAYVRSLTYLTAALTFAVVALALFADPVLQLIVSKAFWGAAPFIPMVAVAYLLRAIGAHLQGVFTSEGKPGLEGKVNIVGATACVGAYAALIPRFRLWGAVAATVFGFLVVLVYSFYEAQRLRYFRFEYARLSRIVGFGGATAGSFYLLHPSDFWVKSGLAFGLVILYGAALLFACLGRAERDSAVSLLSALWKRYFSKDTPAHVAVV
jgi:O-antigen/teichoic acid export membrane protein